MLKMSNALPCACGCDDIRLVTTTTDDKTRYHCECPTCLTCGPESITAKAAIDLWNLTALELTYMNPPCQRCGEPSYPDGRTMQGSDMTYCAVCADDLFG